MSRIVKHIKVASYTESTYSFIQLDPVLSVAFLLQKR